MIGDAAHHSMLSYCSLICPSFARHLQVRWAVLNVVTLLRRHSALHEKLAAAMDQGASVGSCIALIEQELEGLPAEDI